MSHQHYLSRAMLQLEAPPSILEIEALDSEGEQIVRRRVPSLFEEMVKIDDAVHDPLGHALLHASSADGCSAYVHGLRAKHTAALNATR
jgi:hypothetical protein